MTTLTISAKEQAALSLAAVDPAEWLSNLVASRIQVAIADAKQTGEWSAAVASAVAAGISTSDELAIISHAIAAGILETAAARAARLEEEARQRAEEVAAQQPVPETGLSFLQFMDLFTDAEQLALASAAMSDPAVKLWYDRALGAAYVRLDDPRTIAGLEVMVSLGLLDQARADQVLAGEPPEPASP